MNRKRPQGRVIAKYTIKVQNVGESHQGSKNGNPLGVFDAKHAIVALSDKKPSRVFDSMYTIAITLNKVHSTAVYDRECLICFYLQGCSACEAEIELNLCCQLCFEIFEILDPSCAKYLEKRDDHYVITELARRKTWIYDYQTFMLSIHIFYNLRVHNKGKKRGSEEVDKYANLYDTIIRPVIAPEWEDKLVSPDVDLVAELYANSPFNDIKIFWKANGGAIMACVKNIQKQYPIKDIVLDSSVSPEKYLNTLPHTLNVVQKRLISQLRGAKIPPYPFEHILSLGPVRYGPVDYKQISSGRTFVEFCIILNGRVFALQECNEWARSLKADAATNVSAVKKQPANVSCAPKKAIPISNMEAPQPHSSPIAVWQPEEAIAFCAADSCTREGRRITENDKRVQVVCEAGCKSEYHYSCWRVLQVRHDGTCSTADCDKQIARAFATKGAKGKQHEIGLQSKPTPNNTIAATDAKSARNSSNVAHDVVKNKSTNPKKEKNSEIGLIPLAADKSTNPKKEKNSEFSLIPLAADKPAGLEPTSRIQPSRDVAKWTDPKTATAKPQPEKPIRPITLPVRRLETKHIPNTSGAPTNHKTRTLVQPPILRCKPPKYHTKVYRAKAFTRMTLDEFRATAVDPPTAQESHLLVIDSKHATAAATPAPDMQQLPNMSGTTQPSLGHVPPDIVSHILAGAPIIEGIPDDTVRQVQQMLGMKES